ncbi:MAG TPA: hypothetical protein VGB25_10745 [Candidatus Binatia bacterium]
MKRRIPIHVVLAAAMLLVAGASNNAAGEDFYKGKNVNFIVGNAPGGGYDTYTRLTARHIGKHIPGSPTAIVQNRPGGGGLVTANYLYNRSKPNGLTMGVWNSGLIVQQLLGTRSVKFEADKFGWVGAPGVGLPMCAIMAFTGLKSLDEVIKSKRPLKMGATGAGTTTADMPKILNGVLGTNFEVITGYSGSATIRVAMQRHEVDGFCIGWESMRATARPMLEAKGGDRMIPIIIHGKSDDPPVKNLPRVTRVIKGKENLATFNAWVSSYEFQRPISTPPGVPKERLELLRRAYRDTLKDPQLLAEAKKSKLLIDYVSGEQIDKFVAEILATPPKSREALKFLK